MAAFDTRASDEDDIEGREAIAEGLATAFQCFEDGMGEKLESLAAEQAALLATLQASREARLRF